MGERSLPELVVRERIRRLFCLLPSKRRESACKEPQRTGHWGENRTLRGLPGERMDKERQLNPRKKSIEQRSWGIKCGPCTREKEPSQLEGTGIKI